MRPPRDIPPDDNPAPAPDIGWRIHDALRDWTGKVDAKASFALTIESAVLAATVALSGKDGRLSALHHDSLLTYRIGIALLGIAALAAVAAVIPQIRSGPTEREWRNNFIFFGHLRHWQPDHLAEAWASSEVLPVLARQAVVMSKIAWRKHRELQLSLSAAVLGTAALVTAAAIK
jgi:hypothetical protein